MCNYDEYKIYNNDIKTTVGACSNWFYRQELPELDDVVTVMVRSVAAVGAYVTLLEYNNHEGMILLSELSRRRIRSINKLIRVGKTETVVVIRIDDGRDYVDLSKRRISTDEAKKGEEKYIRAKTVYHILYHSAPAMGITTNEEFEHLMSETAWKFHEQYKNCGGAYEAFRRVIKDPSILDECDITEEQKIILIEAIKHRLEPRRVKIRADVDVICYEDEGIEAVKAALMDGIEYSNKTNIPVKINLIAPPVYMVHTMIMDRKEGMEVMNGVIAAIKASIISKGGSFSLKTAPKILNDIDEEELNRQMEKLERANELIDGDEDESSGSDEESDDLDDDESGPDDVQNPRRENQRSRASGSKDDDIAN